MSYPELSGAIRSARSDSSGAIRIAFPSVETRTESRGATQFRPPYERSVRFGLKHVRVSGREEGVAAVMGGSDP